MDHKLIVKSLRDVNAECSCGGWFFSMPTFDRESDEALRAKVAAEHAGHVERVSVG